MFLNCDENLTNADCRFILLADWNGEHTRWSSVVMWSMIALEVMALLAGLVCTTLTIVVVAKRSAIHPNFARIVIVFTSHFYVLAASRIVLLIFQIGVLDVQDPSLLPILVASSIAHFHELGNAIMLFAGFVIERTFATIFIEDYETRKRSIISTVIISVVVPSSISNAYAITYGIVIDIFHTALLIGTLASLLIAAGVIIAAVIYRKNKIHLETSKSTIKYSLSTKFQLVENFRVFETLRNIVIIFAISSAIGSTAFQLHLYYYYKDEILSSLFSELFDLAHSIGNPCCIAMFVLSQPTWRFDFHLRISRLVPFIPAPTVAKISAVVSESYFNELIGSWNRKLAANNKA